MSPFVRGRILPETWSTGRAKASLDVLLWLPRITSKEFAELDVIEILRNYLSSITPARCCISLWLPTIFQETGKTLLMLDVAFRPIQVSKPGDKVEGMLKSGAPQELVEVAATALSVDADAVVISNSDWFPFVTEFDELNMLLADCEVLKRQCEIFVRGHDIPWSFDYMVWNEPWTTFYQMAEHRTFQDGVAFLEHCHKKAVDDETREAARMLVHNRLPNLCFTRDRLLFYDVQQAAAKRASWERQEFLFEAAYYLNFYYMFIFGGFDHLALVVNGALKLGVPPKQVGATYDSFLKPLAARAPEIYALFTAADCLEFQERIGALRHFAAHRGSIMPGKIYEKLDPEPTPMELDAEIAKQGLDDVLRLVPRGPIQDAFRETLRHKVRLRMSKQIAEGVVFLEIRGKGYFIKPMIDIEWNFDRYHEFLVKVLNACKARI